MSTRTKVKTRVESRGVRKRMGREVMDATERVSLFLTKADIAAARAKRAGYDVDDPENFSDCVLATCISKAAGSEVQVFRRHAFLALPDSEYTLRYEVAPETTEIIHLNDEARFDEIEPNVMVSLRPPAPRRRLVAMRANAKKKSNYRSTRGSGRKQTVTDPYAGVWRNGNHSVDG